MLLADHLAREPEYPANGDGLPLVIKFREVDEPLKDHLERERGNYQVEVFQPQRRQPDNTADNRPHQTGHNDHQRPEMSQ